ncbi:hypothetical protein Y1Q_0005458 [Alligator mississippiensis]|uniref:Uncharacterized protein n=1 Tax=Alligator mississippiensis TaxID=8496 RepID=A0A151MEJ1_ALLMI|nr:hypothetical protein Y1Q_0005458 [Alligator mississippiensis]
MLAAEPVGSNSSCPKKELGACWRTLTSEAGSSLGGRQGQGSPTVGQQPQGMPPGSNRASTRGSGTVAGDSYSSLQTSPDSPRVGRAWGITRPQKGEVGNTGWKDQDNWITDPWSGSPQPLGLDSAAGMSLSLGLQFFSASTTLQHSNLRPN